MGDDSFECLSSGSGDSWDILSNSGSEKERDVAVLEKSEVKCNPNLCASCGDVLSDEFLQCLLCKNCYICMKCKAKALHSLRCSELEEHSFISSHRTDDNVSHSENCESDVLSLPETENASSSSVHEHFTDIDNWVKNSSNTESFTSSDFNSIKNDIEVDDISTNSTNDYRQSSHEKSTNQLSQGDNSILNALLQFLQKTNNGPLLPTTESSLFESKMSTVTTIEPSLPKASFQPHHTAAVHNVCLLNMDDSSAFQSWFNLSSSNNYSKQQSLSSRSSSSSLSEANNNNNSECLSRHGSPPPLTTTPATAPFGGGITAATGLFSTGGILKKESFSSSSVGSNSPNRSSPTFDFSPQSSSSPSVSSLSSSPLGAATQFLKSVVKYSAAALNNFDLLSLDHTDEMPIDNWSKSSSSNKQGRSNNTPTSRTSSPTSFGIFSKVVSNNNNNNSNNNNDTTTTNSSLKAMPVKSAVWDSEHLREIIAPKPIPPSSIAEITAYNLR
ncbi:unnamed protein product [Trichobilharzia szidati]|nr:unnamed protein product [Trichobilharzia szidati]